MTFNPCLRSIIQETYKWFEYHRNAGSGRAPLWPSVRGELAMMAIMVPVMASWLDAEWSGRVETSDAAPGGLG
eukprot:11259259-Heterocapsa_arctica.AAC.1